MDRAAGYPRTRTLSIPISTLNESATINFVIPSVAEGPAVPLKGATNLSGIQYAAQQGRLDIAAGYDRYRLPGARQLLPMEEGGGHGDRTARLRHQPCGNNDLPHGFADLSLGHGHDVIDKSLHMGKI